MKAKRTSKNIGGIVNTTESSLPGTAQDRSGGGTRDISGLRRVLGWRPRTTRSKAGIAAVAAVGATGLALALVAGPAGAAAQPVWMMTAGNVQSMSLQDSSSAQYFFNTPAAYGAGASLVKTPVQARYATTPVLAYTSQAQFASDIQSNAISYPYKWVMYDPENWTATPVNERQDPVKYMTLFGQLAHANGLKVVLAPSLDLGAVTGSVLPRKVGETVNQWYLRVNIAGKAAAASDIYVLQNESNTTLGGQYAYMYNTAQTQALTANASARVFSEVSTMNGTSDQMASAAKSISPDGFYVAAAGDIPETLDFFGQMKDAGY
jgi:hypothetical protein